MLASHTIQAQIELRYERELRKKDVMVLTCVYNIDRGRLNPEYADALEESFIKEADWERLLEVLLRTAMVHFNEHGELRTMDEAREVDMVLPPAFPDLLHLSYEIGSRCYQVVDVEEEEVSTQGSDGGSQHRRR